MDTPTPTAPETEEDAGTPEHLMDAAATRIAELEAELQETKDKWMRSEAEMANLRARTKREVDETRQYAVQKFATDVVEAAENLRRGLGSMPPPKDIEPDIIVRLREGFAGTERSFVALLERNGIKGEDPVGAVFDPNMHQAMGEELTDEHPPGTVVKAWTSVWTLNGRLLKPAMVIVSKTPMAAQPGVDTTA